MKRTEAFSLIEVVLAIAIVSFCLVAVLGLLMTSLNSEKRSKEDTLMAIMANDVANGLQQNMYTNFPGIISPAPVTNYFDATGASLSSSSGAYYQCSAQFTGDTNSVSADGTTNQIFVTMNFTWPAGLTPAPNKRSLNAALSKR